MNILISGFGNIGCRHAQAMLKAKKDWRLFVIEPSDRSFEEGLSIIGAKRNNFTRYHALKELNVDIDFAISATCSKPRYSIVKDLIEHGVKYFLIEKIAFQSIAQFESIIKLLKAYDVKAYCDLPRRYYENYIKLKTLVMKSSDPIRINVFGGNNGIGCNAIHSIDLLEYLTESRISKSWSFLREDKDLNKRGKDYRDVNGLLVVETYNEDQLFIYFDPSYRSGVSQSISIENKNYIFSDRDKKEYCFAKEKITSKEFDVPFSSDLTHILVKDIIGGKTILPNMEETKNTHEILFKEISPVLGKEFSKKQICPIT